MPRKLKTPLALRPRTFPAAVSTIGSLTAPPTLSGSAMCWRPGRRATLEERLERGNGQTVTAPDPSRGDDVDVVESAPGFGSRPFKPASWPSRQVQGPPDLSASTVAVSSSPPTRSPGHGFELRGRQGVNRSRHGAGRVNEAEHSTSHHRGADRGTEGAGYRYLRCHRRLLRRAVAGSR